MNNGGIFVLDKTTTFATRVYTGNVYNVAVDDEGVYFGEHDPNPVGGGQPGTLHMLVEH